MTRMMEMSSNGSSATIPSSASKHAYAVGSQTDENAEKTESWNNWSFLRLLSFSDYQLRNPARSTHHDRRC